MLFEGLYSLKRNLHGTYYKNNETWGGAEGGIGIWFNHKVFKVWIWHFTWSYPHQQKARLPAKEYVKKIERIMNTIPFLVIIELTPRGQPRRTCIGYCMLHTLGKSQLIDSPLICARPKVSGYDRPSLTRRDFGLSSNLLQCTPSRCPWSMKNKFGNVRFMRKKCYGNPPSEKPFSMES